MIRRLSKNEKLEMKLMEKAEKRALKSKETFKFVMKDSDRNIDFSVEKLEDGTIVTNF